MKGIARLPPVEYPGHLTTRKVDHSGQIRWKDDERLFLSHTIHNEIVGLEEIDDGMWALFYGPVLLARFDERGRRFYGCSFPARNRRANSQADTASRAT